MTNTHIALRVLTEGEPQRRWCHRQRVRGSFWIISDVRWQAGEAGEPAHDLPAGLAERPRLRQRPEYILQQPGKGGLCDSVTLQMGDKGTEWFSSLLTDHIAGKHQQSWGFEPQPSGSRVCALRVEVTTL